MKENKTIGFICPLNNENSAVRKRSDDVMNYVLSPVAKKMGYTVQRADNLSGSDIMQDIIKMLHDSDIIVADLTDLNPNVFYELGLRQATKGKCINIYCQDEQNSIPFDLGHYRAYAYKRQGNYQERKQFEDYIESRVNYLEKAPWDPVMPLSTAELINSYGLTIVTQFCKGAKNHYNLAKNLFMEPCKTIFLMQRSSSLVLSAEQGWGEEAEFIEKIMTAISQCGFFYHIISLDGIRAHFHRRNSVFPDFEHFSRNLININGNVAIRKTNAANEKIFYLRKLPKDTMDTYFKLDRQSRVLVTEDVKGTTRVVIVQNLGEDQTCFLIEGNKAKDYLNACIDFYNTCELVEWRDIRGLYNEYKQVERSREE